ncbi:MAG: hypothetical protein IT269_00260, partial [Saprospiraceae bacterium]|nr:hypothetical protein [Saprospiraceae bacterium]
MHNPPTTEPKPQPASRQAGAFFGGGATPFFQPKLTVNQPGDAYEQEADHIADKVMRMREGDAPVVQRMFAPAIQRACAHCEEKRREEEGVQRKETNPSPALPNVGGSISADAGGQSAPAIVSDVLSS